MFSYLHDFEANAKAYDKLLRALTAIELKTRILRGKVERLMPLKPLFHHLREVYLGIISTQIGIIVLTLLLFFLFFFFLVVILGCVFVGEYFEVRFGILWSRLMAMITFVCLLFIVVFCY